MKTERITGRLVDVVNREIRAVEMVIENGKIEKVNEQNGSGGPYILPGFVDAHIHIESSLVTPLSFSYEAVKQGTIGVMTDPHEIANVMGVQGVEYMIRSAKKSPLKIIFGAPSCVPATAFESAGATISSTDIETLFRFGMASFLSEMMNFPGVIQRDPEVMEKLKIARKYGVPADGHAPGLTGNALQNYIDSGISTDHECSSIEEAREKLQRGMKIIIREGSAAKNFEELIPLLDQYPDKIMFCTDDLHPDDLINGHINKMVKRALEMGYDLFDVLRAASYNAIKHYGSKQGLLQEGDAADYILVDDLDKMEVRATYIDGRPIYTDQKVLISESNDEDINFFQAKEVKNDDLQLVAETGIIRVMKAADGELYTGSENHNATIEHGLAISDINRDILKIVVLNRYDQTAPAIAFVNGFGLKRGAIASSIGHDSHNIIAVGVHDRDIISAINWIISHKGGIASADEDTVRGLALPVAGIMTNQSVQQASRGYVSVSRLAKKWGSTLSAPFMTLAFMPLLVIPELKISDKGLFDGNKFQFTNLFVEEL